MKERSELAIRTVWLSIVGNASLALIKFLAGFFGNSYALIADAIESTTDIFSSVLVLLGIKYSARPPDEDHPYGHGKAEPLVTFAVVGFLFLSAGVIAWQSIQHIKTPHKVPESYTLYVLAVILIIKEVFYRIVMYRGRKTGSTSLQADAWHHRSDAITSLMAFIGISIALYMGPGYETADDWAALGASAFIIYNAWGIFRPALGEVMDEHMHDDFIEGIRNSSLKIKGVEGTEKCLVRKSGMYYFVDLHVEVPGAISVTEGHKIAHEVKESIKKDFPEVIDVLIHIEPYEKSKT